MQEQISDANVQRHLLSLSVRNLDRKINIIIKSRKMQLDGRAEEDESLEQEVGLARPSFAFVSRCFVSLTRVALHCVLQYEEVFQFFDESKQQENPLGNAKEVPKIIIVHMCTDLSRRLTPFTVSALFNARYRHTSASYRSSGRSRSICLVSSALSRSPTYALLLHRLLAGWA
jgi:hypothetical protein